MLNISKGIVLRPQKVVVYGPEGIGKSTFASHFPDPLFLDIEDSTSQLDVKRIPDINSWAMLMGIIEEVTKEKPCKTLVIDTADLGDYPPTAAQIEAMAQVVAVLAKALWLTIDRDRVLTHAEAADNVDGLLPVGDEYGPQTTCERWDLQYLGTDESPQWTTDYDDPWTGGNIIRGKAIWYRQQMGE